MIESINNETIKNIRKLKDKKYRDEANLYFVEGDHLVLEAYKSGNLVKLITTEDIYDFNVEKICFIFGNYLVLWMSSKNRNKK